MNWYTSCVKKWWPAIVWVGTCEAVGLAATPFTIAAIQTWYASLNKPVFSPPNWVFGPVWTLLYFLMGLAAYLAWKKKADLKYFWVQLLLNFLWSLLFFGLHSPILGFLEIIFLWISIVLTIGAFRKKSKLAANLLIPYLVWVSFAVMLNLAIVALNL